MSLTNQIEALYGAREPLHILPHIGRRYITPATRDLRVMTIGLNAYVSPREWPPRPEWFGTWFRDAENRFDKGVRKAIEPIATHVTGPYGLFDGRTYDGVDSVFHTNAVKTYLPEAAGKKATQVPAKLLLEHAETFSAELNVLAEHGVVPHLILVFAKPAWAHVWRALTAGRSRAFEVLAHEHFPGPCLHFVNRYRVRIHARAGTAEHEILLVRLRHPAARSSVGSPSHLLAEPDFLVASALDESQPRTDRAPPREGSFPFNHNFHASFDRLRLIRSYAGGAVYVGEADGRSYIVVDEGTLAEFLDPDDPLTKRMVHVTGFDTLDARRAAIRRALRLDGPGKPSPRSR